jgi:anti-sigma-K factor RskA
MTDHEEYKDLAAVYALGALDGPEQERFEAHLASGCDACQAELAEARRVADELLFALPPVAPPPGLRERLLARVREDAARGSTGRSGSSSRSAFWISLAAAASLAAAVGLGLHARSLQRRVEAEQAVRLSREQELDRLQQWVQSFTGPRTRTVALAGQGPTPGAQARAFLDPENRRLFLYVYNLPPPPAGRTYQLWLIVGGRPVSAGIFEIQPDGTGRLTGEPLPAFEGTVTVAVTEEPAGGVPQPTGPMVLMGS